MWRIALSMLFVGGLAFGACGKKDEAPAAGPGGEQAKAPPAKAEPPSKDEVAKIDCQTAVDKDVECIKASGINTSSYGASWVKDMVQGCEMLKSVYDPAKETSVMAAAKYVKRAKGSCD